MHVKGNPRRGSIATAELVALIVPFFSLTGYIYSCLIINQAKVCTLNNHPSLRLQVVGGVA